MNLVQRIFRFITQDCVRDGSFGSVQELVESITGCLDQLNIEPKAYT
jgi:hypothetical protein